MDEERKERLEQLLEKQKQKEREVEEKREYEMILEVVQDLFPDGAVEILSREASDKVIDKLFDEFSFAFTGIEWSVMTYKAVFSNSIDYESALAELLLKNHRIQSELCYIIDLNHKHVIQTRWMEFIYRIEEIRMWDRYIYSPQLKLVIEFPSNDIKVGWKKS
ncbi:hypothetical protein SAMN05880501_11564 [Ureibacillus xyleni]|uniref:Uncharacterized protein n=1 Tax=Ureibacillus xyleni TaxID=614648 RepID=A0A285TMK3_9BACL|nr:hypothetical protein [Ureibacillus xyleni]SOC23381.1 hypothetical protein SAMN05880501_11564 [Ureibacillus xyleni]